MSTIYHRDNKYIILKKINIGQWLIAAIMIVTGLFAFYLMVTLVSFSSSDPSWLQTVGDGPIHNIGGRVGAWFADTLFFTFGVLAYIIPVIILVFCWSIFVQLTNRNYIDLFYLSFQIIGILALLLASCSIAELYVDDIYYFASGGIIGILLSNILLPWWFTKITATIALLCVWVFGFIMCSRWSLFTITDTIGEIVLDYLTFIVKNIRYCYEKNDNYYRFCNIQDKHDNTYQYVDDYNNPLLPLYAVPNSNLDLLNGSSFAIVRNEIYHINGERTQNNDILPDIIKLYKITSTPTNIYSLTTEDNKPLPYISYRQVEEDTSL